MGIHEVAIKLGLSYTTNRDAEVHLAKFIAKKFEEAITIFLDTNFNNSNQKTGDIEFIPCLIEVWPMYTGSKRQPKFKITDPFINRHFPELCGELHTIHVVKNMMGSFAETFHHGKDGPYMGMKIAIGTIDTAETIEKVKQAYLKIIATIYHECDHVYSKAEQNDTEGIENSILYFMDKAEIRGHSKELAFLYHHAFPGRKFNYKLLKRHIQEAYKRGEKPFNLVMMYLELFKDPRTFEASTEKARLYIQNRILTSGHIIAIKMCKRTFREYMNYMTYFTKYFNEHPEHRISVNFELK
jgi:hypothetical protein